MLGTRLVVRRPRPQGRLRRGLVVAACAALGALPAYGQHAPHELLFFVSARYWEHRELDTPIIDRTDLTPTVDVFYTRTEDRFRILAEYLATDEESELERLQFGWQFSSRTRLWLGRFHQSSSYWNTEHHHGQFLQTSINRPAIEEFEDLGGILPSHVTGALLEHQREIGANAGLQLSVSTGLTNTLTPDGLEPFDLLDPDSGHGRSTSLRVTFLPDALGDDEIGFTYAHHDVNVAPGVVMPSAWSPIADEIDLTTYGLYAVWTWDRWRLTASTSAVEPEPRGGLGQPASQSAFSYTQIERQVRGEWTVYTRAEHSSGDTGYLELFPKYPHRQGVLGARWLFHSKHALTLEFTNALLGTDHYHRVALQWSAVLP